MVYTKIGEVSEREIIAWQEINYDEIKKHQRWKREKEEKERRQQQEQEEKEKKAIEYLNKILNNDVRYGIEKVEITQKNIEEIGVITNKILNVWNNEILWIINNVLRIRSHFERPKITIEIGEDELYEEDIYIYDEYGDVIDIISDPIIIIHVKFCDYDYQMFADKDWTPLIIAGKLLYIPESIEIFGVTYKLEKRE